VWNDTQDHTKGMNGGKMDMNDEEHQKRGPRNNSIGLDNLENNKNAGSVKRAAHS
jgi:hypothetical protein